VSDDDRAGRKRSAKSGGSSEGRKAAGPSRQQQRRDAAAKKAESGEKPEPPDAYTKALGLLVRREHSRRELERKLSAKGVEPELAGTALDKLGEQGYQDDSRFAEMLVRTRITRGHGPLRIRADLGVHHIDSETSAQVLADAEPDWTVLALEALRRRFGEQPASNQAERIKRTSFLMRRGFTGDSIRAALNHTDD
jgi:regulatory protein